MRKLALSLTLVCLCLGAWGQSIPADFLGLRLGETTLSQAMTLLNDRGLQPVQDGADEITVYQPVFYKGTTFDLMALSWTDGRLATIQLMVNDPVTPDSRGAAYDRLYAQLMDDYGPLSTPDYGTWADDNTQVQLLKYDFGDSYTALAYQDVAAANAAALAANTREMQAIPDPTRNGRQPTLRREVMGLTLGTTTAQQARQAMKAKGMQHIVTEPEVVMAEDPFNFGGVIWDRLATRYEDQHLEMLFMDKWSDYAPEMTNIFYQLIDKMVTRYGVPVSNDTVENGRREYNFWWTDGQTIANIELNILDDGNANMTLYYFDTELGNRRQAREGAQL